MPGPELKGTVTVYGAGIAGLTAAHELSARGFDVEVWEMEGDDKRPHLSGVGGMARTQYGTIRNDFDPTSVPPLGSIRSTRPIVFDQPFGFAGGNEDIDALEQAEADKLSWLEKTLVAFGPAFPLEVVGYPADEQEASAQLAERRAESCARRLRTRLNLGVREVRSFAGPFTASKINSVVVEVRQALVAGEHGFRFFPAFYRHVFDTMKRTPILSSEAIPAAEVAREKEFIKAQGLNASPAATLSEATTQTVFDNLVSTTSQALAFADDEYDPSVLPRVGKVTLETMRRGLDVFLRQFDFTADDMAKLSLKVLKYMTTCSARREREYEGTSWWEFIEGDSFSEKGQARLDAWPRALVAMSAHEADARTQGNIIVQLLLDQILGRTYSDGTLNGPTSEAWLAPWQTFLEWQGVKFFKRKITEFRVSRRDDGSVRIVKPQVEGPGVPVTDCYHVVALPLAEARRIAGLLADSVAPDESGYRTLQAVSKIEYLPDELRKPKPAGALQHLIGIQFIFEQDVQWAHGHLYFPDSAWELTAISQARFWRHQVSYRDRYRGTLSICIGNMVRAGSTGKCAWEMERDELAAEVWKQVNEGLSGRSRRSPTEFLAPPGGLPQPIAYHLDRNLLDDPQTGRMNTSPLLINKPGAWHARPGELSADSAYELVLDRIVFAGTFMKTYTRLTTMEAANESGRHAVNAILREVAKTGPRARTGNLCSIWNPEDHELEDLAFLKEVDAALCSRGLPHLFDILSLDSSSYSELDAFLAKAGGAARNAMQALSSLSNGLR